MQHVRQAENDVRTWAGPDGKVDRADADDFDRVSHYIVERRAERRVIIAEP